MKTPRFWSSYNIISVLLSPIGMIYAAATALRLRRGHPYKADCPVICIGNLTAGGTGKTPVSLAMADLLKAHGKNPYFLTRGYGGRVKNIVVDQKRDQAVDVGDEPLLLATHAPVVVNPDRGEGAKTALAKGADCLIMDDGFQNPTLRKDVSFLVFDGAQGIGNGLAVPAGPLRESFSKGLRRANAIIILGEDKHQIAQKTSLPVFYATIKPVTKPSVLPNVYAFAGIGRPQKFYDSLKSCGVNVVYTEDFPDHHAYTKEELERLITTARSKNLELWTTSKDYVKIPKELQSHFHVLEIGIAWQDLDALKKFLHLRGLI